MVSHEGGHGGYIEHEFHDWDGALTGNLIFNRILDSFNEFEKYCYHQPDCIEISENLFRQLLIEINPIYIKLDNDGDN